MSEDQYKGDPPVGLFDHGRIVFLTVLGDGPAYVAGVRGGDTLISINDIVVAELEIPEEGDLRQPLYNALFDIDPGADLAVTALRDGQQYTTIVQPEVGCRAFVEATAETGLKARTDGTIIQISRPLIELTSNDQLAAIFAHELAHSVLEHRTRLSAAGVSKGFFGEFGRSQRYNRQVEIEADRMMVHLLTNAGYSADVASAFFRSVEGRRATGVMLSFVYPTPTSRAELIEQEIERYLPLRRGPSWPGHLLAWRDRPFTRD